MPHRRSSVFTLKAKARSLASRAAAVTTSGGGSFSHPARVVGGYTTRGTGARHLSPRRADEVSGRRRVGAIERGGMVGHDGCSDGKVKVRHRSGGRAEERAGKAL